MPSSDSHSRVSHEIEIRFYAELNDFLPSKRFQRAFRFTFHGTPSVKDTIEAIGALARYLRLLGFDTTWERNLADEAIIEIARDEHRIILTRDKGILKNGRVRHGYWLRNTDPLKQLDEVIRAIDLGRYIEPYTRCMECNGELQPAERSAVARSVPLQAFLVYRDFKQCRRCHRVYWRGSHLRRLDKIIERARNAASRERTS